MENFREKSFWLSSVPYEPNPPLKGDQKADVVIVGGGFTGISTAYHLKKMAPGLDVAVLEAEVVGFGASGRNGGFAMTLFGLMFGLTALRFGKQKATEAHHYMEKAVDLVGDLVKENKIDCDYERTGFLRVATSEKYKKRILHEIELVKSQGIEGIDWIDQEAVRREVNSPLYLGAWWEPRCALVNPAKLAWGMKAAAERLGARVYENSPVKTVSKGEKIVVKTQEGSVTADKLVFATNAFSITIPELKRKQVPAYTYIVLTEPLRPEHFAEIGWQHRQGIEDARNFVHYYRLTADNRLLMGGRDIGVTYGTKLDKDQDEKIFEKLVQDIHDTFPVLKDIRITHRWGGPVSVPVDMTPALGYLGDKRILYALGSMGHGVSLTHMNGWTLAEMVLGKETERTRIFFVNRKVIPWPGEPLRFVVSQAIKGYMKLEDSLYDPKV